MSLDKLQAVQLLKYINPRQTDFSNLPLLALPYVRGNWVVDPQFETAWSTDVVESDEAVEERFALQSRPQRKQTIQFTGLSQLDCLNILNMYREQTQNKLPTPIYVDRVALQSAVSTSATFYPCDVKYRRFWPGQTIIIDTRDGSSVHTTIAAVTANGLLVQGIPFDLPKSSWIYPTIMSTPQFSMPYQRVTPGIIDSTAMEYSESVGVAALPSNEFAAHNDPLTEVGGMYVFDFLQTGNYSGKVVSAGRTSNSGRGQMHTVRGAPRFAFSSTVDNLTRQGWWKLLQFFDAHKGRAKAFRMRNLLQPFSDFRRVTSTQMLARAEVAPLLEDYIVFVDGQKNEYWRLITNVDVVGTAAQITHEAQDPNFLFPTTGHTVRFESDVMREVWKTFDVTATTLTMLGINEETEVTL